MATPFSKPLEYAEYIEPVDMDLLLKAVTYKQGKYDLNKQRVSNLVNQAITMPFAKEEDREYFDSRMAGLINELNRYGAGDLSSDTRADYLVGFLSQAADESVANGVEGTLWKQQYDASALEARKENPESFSERNYQYGLQNYNEWLNDRQVGTDVNDYSNPWTGKGVGRYQPFVNVDAMLREELEKIDPEITFEISPFGNGIQYYKNKYELITDEKLLNSINLQVEGNPQLQTQLDINAWSTYSGATSEQLTPQIQEYYQGKAAEAGKNIEYFRQQKAGASTQELAIINQEIDNLKKLQNNFTQQASLESVNATLANPSARVATLKNLYRDGLYSSYAYQYAQTNLVDMDIFTDEAAKISATASANAEAERMKQANDVLLKAYEADGKGETALADAYVGYLEDVLQFNYEVPGTGIVSPSGMMALHRMGEVGTALKDESIQNVSITQQFLAKQAITQQQVDEAISSIASSTDLYGATRAETVATINSWSPERLTEEINRVGLDPIVKGQLEILREGVTMNTTLAQTHEVAVDLTYAQIESKLRNGETAWTGGGYAGYRVITDENGETVKLPATGTFLRVENGELVGYDYITPKERAVAFQTMKDAEYEANTRPIAGGGYGKVGGWFVNRGVDFMDFAGNLMSAPYDFGPGRVTTGGRYINSYRQNRLEANLDALYENDPTPDKRIYGAVSGFRGYDVDGDNIADPGATSGTPVYGEGLVRNSQMPISTQLRQELGKGIFTYLTLMPQGNIAKAGTPALGGVIGPLGPGRIVSRIPGVRTLLPRYTGRAALGRNLQGLFLGTAVGTGADVANVLIESEMARRGAYNRNVNRRGQQLGIGFEPQQQAPTSYGGLRDLQFFRRGLASDILASDVLGDDDALRQAIGDAADIDFMSKHDGLIFSNGRHYLGAILENNLEHVLIQNNAQAIPTRQLSLNSTAARPYLEDIFNAMTPDGVPLFPDIPELQSAESFKAAMDKDPTEDQEALLLDIKGIGGGQLQVVMQRGDDEPVVKMFYPDKNSDFYKQILVPETLDYNNQMDNMLFNVGNMAKSRDVIAKGTKVLPDGTIVEGSPLTNKLQSTVMLDEETGLFIRPEYSMTYEPNPEDGYSYASTPYDGNKVLRMRGVTILNSDNQVLGFVEKAGAFNFNQIIATTRPSSAQEPGVEDLLFNVGDNVLSVEAANAFFSNEDQVQAVIDEFSKSQSK